MAPSNIDAEVIIGQIYLAGFTDSVPVGTFDRDVPLGMKYLRGALLAVAAAEREKRDLENYVRFSFNADDDNIANMTPAEAEAREMLIRELDEYKTEIRDSNDSMQMLRLRRESITSTIFSARYHLERDVISDRGRAQYESLIRVMEDFLEQLAPGNFEPFFFVSQAEKDAMFTAASTAEDLIHDFHSAKSYMGCGSPKARKLCSGCLDFDKSKVRYCGEACQLIHWRHKAASHKAECGSRAPGGTTRNG